MGLMWSEQAQEAVSSLPVEARETLKQRGDYLQDMPRLYQISDDERFPGCRTFWIEPCYRAYYMVAAGGDDVYMVAILPQEVDGPTDEAIDLG